MKPHWQQYFLDVITHKRIGVTEGMLRKILHAASWGFKCTTICRNWAFDHHWLKSHSPPVPLIISVGNIVAGGTGKTPVTLMLAQEFYHDTKMAILSRGYRSRAEHAKIPLILCQGNGPLYTAAQGGDEPFLLASRLPKAIVVIGKDRRKTAALASKAGAEVILLDDGMQHRQLARDFDVVVINAHDPFGQGYLLPRGLLRESLPSLRRAHLIVLNHVTDTQHYASLLHRLRAYTDAPVIGTRLEASRLYDENGSLASIKGQSVAIFCGIAHPEQFEQTVASLGAKVIAKRFLADHQGMSAQQLMQFSHECRSKGAERLLCTEKDFVKLNPSLQTAIPVGCVQMDLRIIEGASHWHHFIQQAKAKVVNS